MRVFLNTIYGNSWLQFDPTSVRVGILVDRVALCQVFLRVIRFPPVSIIPSVLLIIFINILLLQEGQAGEVWEPSNKAVLFRISGCIG